MIEPDNSNCVKMNCPSRTDETLEHPGWNQNPSPLNRDITTRNDFNGIANSKVHRRHAAGVGSAAGNGMIGEEPPGCDRAHDNEKVDIPKNPPCAGEVVSAAASGSCEKQPETDSESPRRSCKESLILSLVPYFHRIGRTAAKFARFLGPGFLVAVAYIDPGNYSTDVAAGAQYRYALLFIVLVSNLFAIFLQALCIKLGTVTGLNLAENCKEHFPKWVVIILYVFSEAAIVATDIAEVSFAMIAIILYYSHADWIGYWIGHCTQSPAQDSVGGWMCHYPGRCALPAHLLQT